MIGGLVLAAGEGTRYAAGFKLLASIDGTTVLGRAVRAQTAVAELERVVVVLGCRSEEVLSAVDLGRAEPCVCERWPEGLSASLRCGVNALSGAERVLVTLGDVPTLNAAVVRRLLRAPDGARASYGGRPGHPVVLGPAQLRAIAGVTGDVGARAVLGDGPLIECSDLSSGRDVDTVEDLEVIRDATGAIV